MLLFIVFLLLVSFNYCVINWLLHRLGGARWRSRLRYCASSIPEGVSGIFHSPNPAGRPIALGSTQGLTEMSTIGISFGGGGGPAGA